MEGSSLLGPTTQRRRSRTVMKEFTGFGIGWLGSCWRDMQEDRLRPWADLCPDLLNSIYHNLPPGPAAGRMEFGSVCKSWHQIFRRRSPASWAPLKPEMSSDVLSPEIPDEIRKELCSAYVKYSWTGSGWWLLSSSSSGGEIFALFNPLFRWPSSFIRLPVLPHSVYQPPLKAAFSASPTDPDWTLCLVRGCSRISTFRRGRRRWSTYTFGGKGDRRRICEGIGYREGSFFCLFDTGDVLIFGVDGGGRQQRRSMLVAVAAPPVMLARQSYLRVLAEESGGKYLVMSWGRWGVGSAGGSRLRLLSVGRVTAAGLEGGRRLGSDILVKEQPGVDVEGDRFLLWLIVLLLIFLVWCDL